jgi:AraC-like DNA-binding protein
MANMANTFLVDTDDFAELNNYQPHGLDREFYLLSNGERRYRFQGVYLDSTSWVEYADLFGPNRLLGGVREGSLHIAFVWNDDVRMIDTRFSGQRMFLGLAGSPWEGASLHPARCYNMILDWDEVRLQLSDEAQARIEKKTNAPWGKSTLVAEPSPLANRLCRAMQSCLTQALTPSEAIPIPFDKHAWLCDLTDLTAAVIEGLTDRESPESIEARTRRSVLAREVETMLWKLPTPELSTLETRVQDIAQRLYASKRTLQLALYEFFGIGFVALSRAIRMHRFRNALLTRPQALNIAHLAQEFGFSHLGRFSVQYREIFGHSPSILKGQILRKTPHSPK